MAKVDVTTPPNREMLSSRRRLWLTLWSLLRLMILLPLWVLGLAALLLGVALSPWGTAQLFSQGEQRGWFSYEQQEGALLESFRLQGFHLAMGGTQVTLDEVELAWADDCLLSGRLCLERLHLSGADIRLAASDAPEEPDSESTPLSRIHLPFPIELRDIDLSDVQLHLADGTHVAWERFTTSLSGAQQQVIIEPTRLERLAVHLPLSPGGQLTEDIDTPLTAVGIDSAIQVNQPHDEEPIVGSPAPRERLSLPAIELPIDVAITSLLVTDVSVAGAFTYDVERVLLAGHAERDNVVLSTLEVDTRDATARLMADVTLADDYPLEAELHSVLLLPELFPALSGETLTLRLSGSLADLSAELDVSGQINATLAADVDVLAPDVPFTARLQSERVEWPLESMERDPDATYVAQDVELTVNGSLDAYAVRLLVDAQAPQVPDTSIDLTGDGDMTSFRWAPLNLRIEESRLTSEGQVNWADALRIDANVQLSNLDPSLFVDQLEGNLNGRITASVQQQGERWDIALPELAIDGELQEYPLTLAAALEANSDLEVDIERLLFTQGNNRLTASGQVSEQAMSLQADIALTELQTLHPELAGRLNGDLRATGSFSAPALVARLTGNQLRFAENRIDNLGLAANVQGIDDPTLRIELDAQNVNAGGQALSNLAINLNGRLSQHTLNVTVDGAPGNVLSAASLALDGRFNQATEQYQARLMPLELDSEAGSIRLEAPLDIGYNLANGQARLSPFCLRRLEGGLVCSDEPMTASAEQGQASLRVSEVPMEMLEPFLPEEWRFEGATTAELAASWRQGGARWQADVQVLSELAITAINDYGQPVALPVLSLDTQIEANQSQADANLLLSLSEAGEITLDLSVNDPLGQGALAGELRANNVSLEPYRPMMLGMDRLEGALNGSVQIGGSTQQPDLQGQLALRGLRVHGPDIPVDVQDGEFGIIFDGERGDIDGFVAAERGRLNISGEAYWPASDAWRIGIDLNATQEPLLVVLPQFGRMEAAPDIRVRITPERLQVRGNVDLPWARLEIGDLPSSATSPSPDEIIITERDDREAEQARQRAIEAGEDPSAAEELAATGMAIDVLITLTLGRDMQISAYGLESGLGGSLEIRQESGVLQLFGDVNLVDGRFQAFGQDLLIRRGQLLFSGPPGLPVLDFEAIRNPDITEDEVIAGLRVSGNAEEPNVLIFAEPSMDETRALSYLLRGRAPDASGGGIDSALTTALIGMSLGRTGGAVGSLGQAFGIDDLTLDTTGAGDESQVAVSGQLTDDLRISYGVGIFSPIAELTLRYTLWRNLYLQAVSGANQAVDLIYTFTRSGDPYVYPQQ